jgi:3-hydroxyisobutyrate dehydrogenase-like beta-hydroxyacid dehydrogenase
LKIGFCGLGQMGAPMAERLLNAGHELVVWNRTPEKAERLVRAGATRAGSPAEAAAGADAVITMLASPEAVEHVVFGDEGVAKGISSGATLIEMSTIGPDAVKWIRERLGDDIEVVDAPVLGSIPQATEGSLKVFVGSSADTFTRLRDLLTTFGEPRHIGPLGSGAAIKLVVNSILGALQLAWGEAMALADGLALDTSSTLDVLEESPIGPTVQKKRKNLESGIFEPNFKLSLAVKDMRLVTQAAKATDVELRGAAAAKAAFEAAEQAGLGDCDYSAVAAFLSGREAKPA